MHKSRGVKYEKLIPICFGKIFTFWQWPQQLISSPTWTMDPHPPPLACTWYSTKSIFNLTSSLAKRLFTVLDMSYVHSCLQLAILIRTSTNNPSHISVALESSVNASVTCQFNSQGLFKSINALAEDSRTIDPG